MILLSGHTAIGWDFDGTIFDHEKSPAMHDFIRLARERRHVIVTFRSHGIQHDVFPLLRMNYDWHDAERFFDGIVNIPDDLFVRTQTIRRARRFGQFTGPLTEAERDYVEWKGLACRRAGLTVLIDDLTDEVLPGCNRYGIQHIHPDDL